METSARREGFYGSSLYATVLPMKPFPITSSSRVQLGYCLPRAVSSCVCKNSLWPIFWFYVLLSYFLISFVFTIAPPRTTSTQYIRSYLSTNDFSHYGQTAVERQCLDMNIQRTRRVRVNKSIGTTGSDWIASVERREENDGDLRNRANMESQQDAGNFLTQHHSFPLMRFNPRIPILLYMHKKWRNYGRQLIRTITNKCCNSSRAAGTRKRASKARYD